MSASLLTHNTSIEHIPAVNSDQEKELAARYVTKRLGEAGWDILMILGLGEVQ